MSTSSYKVKIKKTAASCIAYLIILAMFGASSVVAAPTVVAYSPGNTPLTSPVNPSGNGTSTNLPPQNNPEISGNSLNAWASFKYTVVSGDTLGNIASKFGVAYQYIQYFNNILNPNIINLGQTIWIPFTTDPVAVNTGTIGISNANQFDYQIVQAAVKYDINPMLLKAQIWQESNFNDTVISRYDTTLPCGGHSFGLMQWTPACNPTYGTTTAYAANAEVKYGLNGVQPWIECTSQSGCTFGDWFANEYSSQAGHNITEVLLTSPQFAPYDISVWNATYNVETGAMFDNNTMWCTGSTTSCVAAWETSNHYSCNWLQTEVMGMAVYNWGSTGVLTGCATTTSGFNSGDSTYGYQVISKYGSLISAATAPNINWCDWFSNSGCSVYGSSPSYTSKFGYLTDYWYNDHRLGGINWNNSAIADTGYNVQSSTYQPWCPSSVSVLIYGTAHGDSYSRYLSVNFTDGGSTDQLVTNAVVSGSFSLYYNVSSTYLTSHNTASAPFYLTTYVGYWNITETIHYDSSSSC